MTLPKLFAILVYAGLAWALVAAIALEIHNPWWIVNLIRFLLWYYFSIGNQPT